MAMGNAFPVVCTVPGTQIIVGLWTQIGAPTGNPSIAPGDVSSGISSVVRVSVGRYRLTLPSAGARLLAGVVEHGPLSISAPLIATVNFSTFVAQTASAAATIDVTLWATAAATLTDLPTNDKLSFLLRFAKNVQS